VIKVGRKDKLTSSKSAEEAESDTNTLTLICSGSVVKIYIVTMVRTTNGSGNRKADAIGEQSSQVEGLPELSDQVHKKVTLEGG